MLDLMHAAAAAAEIDPKMFILLCPRTHGPPVHAHTHMSIIENVLEAYNTLPFCRNLVY